MVKRVIVLEENNFHFDIYDCVEGDKVVKIGSTESYSKAEYFCKLYNEIVYGIKAEDLLL